MNRRIVLARRPQGTLTLDCFRLETTPVPAPQAGEVLLRTLFLSLDPYMRGRMNGGPSYAEPVAVDEVMCGATVCRVMDSRSPDFQSGEIVLAYSGWQDYAAVPATALTRLDPQHAPVSWALGVLGMPGLTAYVGLLDIGKPKAGDTVVVAAATGAVGATVGQIAKIKGCLIVGVAGGAEKCAYAVRELGFDACIDHTRDDFAELLKTACPRGIDVYFENVGGAVLMAVLPLLNVGARMPVCGTISWYNVGSPPEGLDRAPLIMRSILVKRLQVQGFIIFDHDSRRADFVRDMSAWLASKQVKYREDIIEGLETAPQGLIGMMSGHNFGKLVVHVAD